MPSFWVIKGQLHRYCPKELDDCIYCQFFKLMQPPEPGKERTWKQIWTAFKHFTRESYDKRFKPPTPPPTPPQSIPESSIHAADDCAIVEPVQYRVVDPDGIEVRQGIELNTPVKQRLDPGSILCVHDIFQESKNKVCRLRIELAPEVYGWVSEEYDPFEGQFGPRCEPLFEAPVPAAPLIFIIVGDDGVQVRSGPELQSPLIKHLDDMLRVEVLDATAVEFRVDVSELKSRKPGLHYRMVKDKSSDARDPDESAYVAWGETVEGVLEGDWVRVPAATRGAGHANPGPRYLPRSLHDRRVLVPHVRLKIRHTGIIRTTDGWVSAFDDRGRKLLERVPEDESRPNTADFAAVKKQELIAALVGEELAEGFREKPAVVKTPVKRRRPKGFREAFACVDKALRSAEEETSPSPQQTLRLTHLGQTINTVQKGHGYPNETGPAFVSPNMRSVMPLYCSPPKRWCVGLDYQADMELDKQLWGKIAGTRLERTLGAEKPPGLRRVGPERAKSSTGPHGRDFSAWHDGSPRYVVAEVGSPLNKPRRADDA